MATVVTPQGISMPKWHQYTFTTNSSTQIIRYLDVHVLWRVFCLKNCLKKRFPTNNSAASEVRCYDNRNYYLGIFHTRVTPVQTSIWQQQIMSQKSLLALYNNNFFYSESRILRNQGFPSQGKGTPWTFDPRGHNPIYPKEVWSLAWSVEALGITHAQYRSVWFHRSRVG